MNKPNRSRRKRPDSLPDSATNPGPKPGDFPLGSLESRAAARAMIDNKQDDGRLRGIQIIYVGPDGKGGWKEENGPFIEIPPV